MGRPWNYQAPKNPNTAKRSEVNRADQVLFKIKGMRAHGWAQFDNEVSGQVHRESLVIIMTVTRVILHDFLLVNCFLFLLFSTQNKLKLLFDAWRLFACALQRKNCLIMRFIFYWKRHGMCISDMFIAERNSFEYPSRRQSLARGILRISCI